EICVKHSLPKNGTKDTLRQRIQQLIEDHVNCEHKWSELKKEIKRVYKANDRIKKSPKKAKLKKPSLSGADREGDHDYDDYASHESQSHNEPNVGLDGNLSAPVLNMPNLTTHMNECNNNYSLLSYFKSTTPQSTPFFNGVSSQPLPYPQSNHPLNYSTAGIPPSMTASGVMPANQVHNHNVSHSQQFYSHTNPFPLMGPQTGVPPPPLFNTVNPRPASAQPVVRHQSPAYNAFNSFPPHPYPQQNYPFMGTNHNNHNNHNNNYYHNSNTAQNLSQQNYYQNPSAPDLDLFDCQNPQNFDLQQNYYQNPSAPDLDLFDCQNPQNFDLFVKQQKFLLSQYTPKQTTDGDDNADDCDHPIGHEFSFKALQSFTTIKRLLEAKTIGSISDIGFNIEFNINLVDLDANNFNANLQSLLREKSYQIQLRFSYISDVQIKEQKDCIPEFLCIECNNTRVFTSSQFEELPTPGPFDLSEWCVMGPNKVRFWMSKEKYTFLMPCLYEVSIVSFETPETFLYKLKANGTQFLGSQTTKDLIKSRSEQPSHDDIIISITNTTTKVKLICPLSCARIETPCRTAHCKHMECFDAHSFFKANDCRYDWLCPICQKAANFELLRIDGYFSEVLANTDDNITEVFIKSDASYDVINNVATGLQVIELDDSLDDFECSVIDADGCIVID
ncbi:unnamed protein product, partial [Oppiella nova]